MGFLTPRQVRILLYSLSMSLHAGRSLRLGLWYGKDGELPTDDELAELGSIVVSLEQKEDPNDAGGV